MKKYLAGINHYLLFILTIGDDFILKKFLVIFIVLIIGLISIKIITNPLWKPVYKIRVNLLRELPIGTKLEDVIKYIESKNLEIRWINYEQGFYYRSNIGNSNSIEGDDRVIGDKSIRILLGKYNTPFEIYVIVYFGFNKDGKLIEIWVLKETEVL
jgi:hypothetical protein